MKSLIDIETYLIYLTSDLLGNIENRKMQDQETVQLWRAVNRIRESIEFIDETLKGDLTNVR